MRSLAFWTVAMLLIGSALGGCIVGGAQPGENHAMRNGYSYLGERWVAGTGQAVHEAIGGLARDGAFTSMMLVVENAPVQMDDVVVTFGNHEQWRPGTRLEFGPNGTTREIGLPGGVRHIARVDFVMQNLPR